MTRILGILIVFAGLFFAYFAWNGHGQPSASPSPTATAPQTIQQSQTQAASASGTVAVLQPTQQAAVSSLLSPPLPNALSRVTKKPFGIYITPQNSPVSPERFRGYHTGVDFETTPDEQDVDIAVSAVCDGPLVMKKTATGYGGVAVQQCKLNGEDVTAVYGHLKYASIKPNVRDELKAGETFAILGKGYSTETDGERKHLHLGIHKGTAVNILGYVQNKADLSQWLDAAKYL